MNKAFQTHEFSPPKHAPLRFPCSLAQKRFWIADRLIPGNTSLNLAVRWRLEGDIAAQTVERALSMLIERHETLRTRFVLEGGEPIQVVETSALFRMAEIDLRGLPEADAKAEAERLSHVEARTRFVLAAAPLLRAMLIRIREGEAMLLVTTHQTVCDGWGVGILARELAIICDALQTGKTPDLPALPLAYGEFALWQREWAESEEMAAAGESLRRTYQGVRNFELPTDFPRPDIQTMEADIRSRLLDRELTDRFGQTARQKGCTMFMAALAALFTVLHRYSGESELNVGTQVAGRGEVEVENLIGYFINTLIFRIKLDDDPSFEELLSRASDVVMGIFDNEHLPYEKLVEFVRPKPDLSRNTLFSINFVIQRSFITNQDYKHFKLIDLPSVSTGAIYDMFFFMVERPEGWRLSCEFNASLFKADTVDRLLEEIVNIMRRANEDSTRRISELAFYRAAPGRFSQPDAVPAIADSAPLPAETEEKLAIVWARAFGVDRVDRQANFFELGGDAMGAIRLARAISEEFGQPVDAAALFKHPSVAALAPMLKPGSDDGEEHFQVIELQEEGSRLPLLVINMMWPGRYLELCRLLGPDQPFIGLQVFDLTRPETFSAKTYEELAARYVKLIRRVQPKGPYALFGWCAGGPLAFAVAQQLTGEGEKIKFLGVLDIWAPDHFRRLDPWHAKLIYYWETVSFLLQLIKEDWAKVRAGKKGLGRFLFDRVPGKVTRLLKKREAAVPESRAEVADFTGKLLDYLKRLANAYEPEPFPGKITLMLSKSEAKRWFLAPARGWDRLAGGGLNVSTVIGDHFSVFQEPGVTELAAHLRSKLASCQTVGQ
jgi:thioesterase domain-containing protein